MTVIVTVIVTVTVKVTVTVTVTDRRTTQNHMTRIILTIRTTADRRMETGDPLPTHMVLIPMLLELHRVLIHMQGHPQQLTPILRGPYLHPTPTLRGPHLLQITTLQGHHRLLILILKGLPPLLTLTLLDRLQLLIPMQRGQYQLLPTPTLRGLLRTLTLQGHLTPIPQLRPMLLLKSPAIPVMPQTPMVSTRTQDGQWTRARACAPRTRHQVTHALLPPSITNYRNRKIKRLAVCF